MSRSDVQPAGRRKAQPSDRVEPSCSFLPLPPTHCCTIVESVSEGVFTIDPEKNITYINPAAEKITGFSATEAVGQKCFDIFRADICARNCPLETALLSGRPLMNLRAFIIDKSGARIAVSMNAAALKQEVRFGLEKGLPNDYGGLSRYFFSL